jgi:carbamoyl-phosphate synthase large subunit
VRGQCRPTREDHGLGGGPNRIGQGIEFDYCCVHAAMAMREDGYETIMVNCNPETVSTDYDTSDRLYFEPLTLEDVLEIVRVEKPKASSSSTAARPRSSWPWPWKPTACRSSAPARNRSTVAEDRERFQKLLRRTRPEAAAEPAPHVPKRRPCGLAAGIGYPLVVRPSYVLGGRAMEIVYDRRTSSATCARRSRFRPIHRCCWTASSTTPPSGRRCLLRRRGRGHRRHHGAHRGGRRALRRLGLLAAALHAEPEVQDELRRQTKLMAKALNVCGLMNVQFAIKDNDVYVLEVNPRASRTVPFVSKATGVQLAKIAARCMAGAAWRIKGVTTEVVPPYYSVKEAVFPFVKFPGVDTILGPEMKSTGEVMGVGKSPLPKPSSSRNWLPASSLPRSGQGVPVGQGQRQAEGSSRLPVICTMPASSWWRRAARPMPSRRPVCRFRWSTRSPKAVRTSST